MVPRPLDPVADGAVAIVTGGSWDARRALTAELADRGYAVVVAYLRDQRQAEDLAAATLQARGRALTVRADITDHLDVDRLFCETAAAFGRIDVVVHTGLAGSTVVYAEAARRLSTGGTIVSTVNGFAAGLQTRRGDDEVAELVGLLDR